MLPRRFALIRHIDYTGVSGIGVVAYGVTFADGQVVLRWCSNHPATSMWNSMEDMLAVHGHGEATSVEWIDAPHGDLEGFPGPAGGRRGRRRRTDRPTTPATQTAADEKPSSAPELPRRPVDRGEPSAAAPARDEAGQHADAGQDLDAGRDPSAEAAPAAGPDPTTGSPGHQAALSAGPDPAARTADATEPAPAPTAAASDPPTQRREQPFLRPVRSDTEPSAAPLLTSTETDHRNGHLYIDTAPLLLTFRDSNDELAREQPQARRAGRHRRRDSDAAG